MLDTSNITKNYTMPQSVPPCIDYVCRIDDNSILCWGLLRIQLTGEEQLSVNDIPANRPYLAARLSSENTGYTAMLLHLSGHEIETVHSIAVSSGQRLFRWHYDQEMDDHAEQFAHRIDVLTAKDRIKLFFLLLTYVAVNKEIILQPQFIYMCNSLRRSLQPHAAETTAMYWLLPNVLYFEAVLPERDYSKIRAVMTMNQGLRIATVDSVALASEQIDGSAKRYAFMIHFNRGALDDLAQGSLSLLLNDTVIALKKSSQSRQIDMGALIAYLHQLSERRRLDIRDFINRCLMERMTKQSKDRVIPVVRHLQNFLMSSHTSVHDIAAPIGLNIEVVLPIENEGYFVAGWVFDPQQLIEKMTLLSDVGMSLDMPESLTWLKRPDIVELYKDSPFYDGNHNLGFFGIVALNDDQKKFQESFPTSVSYRFRAELKGGLTYIISPERASTAASAWRTLFLERVAGHALYSTPIQQALLPVARAIQQVCVQNAEIASVHYFATPVSVPNITVIIPLFGQYEYIQAQLAHFAHDDAMQSVEIIYVLDAPDDEERVKEWLQQFSDLYHIAITLLVMNKNAGYATATNLAAKAAQGTYLLLMNSDVVPMDNGWLVPMLACLEARSDIGAVAPKLLYEDESIQHAGMYFEMNLTQGYYENKHHYKGYPSSYIKACESRDVAAVSGACLLIKASVFEESGQLSQHYLVGDYEDSDLCLRLSEMSYGCHYLADVSLYHFERQSFRLSQVAQHQQARYWINARLHHDRWSDAIEKVMKNHG